MVKQRKGIDSLKFLSKWRVILGIRVTVRHQRVVSHRRQQKIERRCCTILPKEKVLPGITSATIVGGHFQNHLKNPQKDQRSSVLFHKGKVDIQIKVIITGIERVEAEAKAKAEVGALGEEGEVIVQGMRRMEQVFKLRKRNRAHLKGKVPVREKRYNSY